MAWCLVKHRDNFTFTFTTNPTNSQILKALEGVIFTVLPIASTVLLDEVYNGN
jgi:hypothetical protein